MDLKSEDVQVQLEPKSTKIVILLGWSGSSHKNLGKYSQIYQKKGFSTIQVIQEPVSIFGLKDTNNLMQNVLKSMDLHFDFSNTKEKFSIIFHVFSNGGFVRFFKTMEYLEEKYTHWKPFIKGIFFDSCPGRLYPNSGALAASAYSSNIIMRNLLYIFFYIAFFLIGIAFGNSKFFDLWTAKALTCKVFDSNIFYAFIYSKTDELINYKDVNEFIVKLEKEKKNVKKLLLEKSPHVQHLLKNNDDYLKILEDNLKFIQ